jgi:hypothetical protein
MRRVGSYFLAAFVSFPLQQAAAGAMPDIKASARNAVPECVTPGRLIEYLKSRNPELDPRFLSVPVEYMRIGEQLGVRWDYAFYQMILETGALSYRRGNRSGDVKASQNNFAGLGATGGGASGESFKDVATGVRAHLEHLLHYAGVKLDNPTAERTRKVQEWGVLAGWHAQFNRPINFADLAAKWAPGSNSYAKMLEAIAERFNPYCGKPDPRPELVAEARGRTQIAAAAAKPDRPSGSDLAKRAIADGKAEGVAVKSALGAVDPPAERPAAAGPAPYKLLNAPPPSQEAADQALSPAQTQPQAQPEPPANSASALPPARSDADAKAAAAAPPAKTAPKTTASVNPPPKAAPEKQAQSPFQVASAAGAAKPMAPPPAAGTATQKCRVWTASYGGQKALIIKSVVDKIVNYTVLDVNEGAEKREADAFISAYAKDGAIAGEYSSQSQALDKAFELCPEG